MTIKEPRMVVNVADAKSRFSHLLTLAALGKDEVIIAKRNKPTAVLVSYETFMKMKRKEEAVPDKAKLAAMPSSLDRFIGILSDDEVDEDYKASRERYLKEKYL